MNNATRKQIDALIAIAGEFCDADALLTRALSVDAVKAVFADIESQLTSMADEEQEKYDNAADSLKDSERVQKFQEASDALNDAVTEAQNVQQLELADGESMEDYYEAVAEASQLVIDECETAKAI